MDKQRTVTCHHPNLRPTKWNEPKPAPTKVKTCECGETWVCPVCGEGHIYWPHYCKPEDKPK